MTILVRRTAGETYRSRASQTCTGVDEYVQSVVTLSVLAGKSLIDAWLDVSTGMTTGCAAVACSRIASAVSSPRWGSRLPEVRAVPSRCLKSGL